MMDMEYGIWWLPPMEGADEVVYPRVSLEDAKYGLECVEAVGRVEGLLGDWGIVQRTPGGVWKPYIDKEPAEG